MNDQKALFLDRDGVINTNYGYVYRKNNFHYIDGIFNVVKHANINNYKVVIITNQSGIARGFYSEQDFHKITDWMIGIFASRECLIDKVYFSPFHPFEGRGKYLKDDISRKPRPGMILEAQKDLNLSLSECVLIGDKLTDIQAGIAGGIKNNILFDPNNNTANVKKCFKIITNLDQATQFIN